MGGLADRRTPETAWQEERPRLPRLGWSHRVVR